MQQDNLNNTPDVVHVNARTKSNFTGGKQVRRLKKVD